MARAELAWTWACATFAGSRRGGRGSALAAPALLILSVVPALLPDSVAFYVSPGAPGFAESRLRWAVLLVAGLTVLLLAAFGRRPAVVSLTRSRADE